MPTYDYKCPKCSIRFEKFHGISETPDVACPQCGTTSNKQIGGGAGILFKGTGFYTTDYKTGSNAEKSPAKTCAGGACGCG